MGDGLLTPGSYRGVGEAREGAWAAPGHMTWYLPWRICTYPKAQRAACAHPLVRRGLSLISLNGFSRKPVGLLSGLFTPDPLRGVIIGKLPAINRLMAT